MEKITLILFKYNVIGNMLLCIDWKQGISQQSPSEIYTENIK